LYEYIVYDFTNAGHHFREYPVVPSLYDVAPQELLRMNISSFTGHLKQMRNDSMSLKVKIFDIGLLLCVAMHQ